MPEGIFNGSAGRLEGRYHQSKRANAPIALLLHSHPQSGGTLNNPVMYALSQCFVRSGFSVLRFNFRGVGRSEGRFDNGAGELSDAASALGWMQAQNPNPHGCWIVGFSFGAWIAMQLLMRRPEISAFVTVAPPAGMNDFTFLAPCPASGLIIHGDKDGFVPLASVDRLAQKLASRKAIAIEYQVIRGSDHFFRSYLEAVGKIVDGYLKKMLTTAAA